jgi:hypothetical protein
VTPWLKGTDVALADTAVEVDAWPTVSVVVACEPAKPSLLLPLYTAATVCKLPVGVADVMHDASPADTGWAAQSTVPPTLKVTVPAPGEPALLVIVAV